MVKKFWFGIKRERFFFKPYTGIRPDKIYKIVEEKQEEPEINFERIASLVDNQTGIVFNIIYWIPNEGVAIIDTIGMVKIIRKANLKKRLKMEDSQQKLESIVSEGEIEAALFKAKILSPARYTINAAMELINTEAILPGPKAMQALFSLGLITSKGMITKKGKRYLKHIVYE